MRQKIKRLISLLLKSGVTIGVIYWIISKFGWEKITSTIAKSDPFWIAIGILLFVVSILLGAFQWRILLKNRGLDLPIKKTIYLYFTGIFFNNFMLGMVAGDSYKVAHLHFNEGKAKSGFAATFYDRIAGLLAIAVFALGGGLWLFFADKETRMSSLEMMPLSIPFTDVHLNMTPEMWINGTLILTFFFAIILAMFFIMFISKRLQVITLSLAGKIASEKIRLRTQSILKELFIDRHDSEEKRTFAVVLVYSFIIQSLRMIVHIMAAISLGIFQPETLHYFFIIIPIIAFMTIVPLPFGIRETLGGTLFLAAGYNHDEAVVMEFLATLIGIAGSLFGGITFILDRKKRA